MIEVEIKVQIPNANDMRKLFEKEGGKYELSLLHEDTYFNAPDQLRDFKKSDEALRIRNSTEYRRDEPEVKKTRHFLTYKGKKMDETTKTRQELELIVEDGETMGEILKVLGFQKLFIVKKERELYVFEHEGHEIEALIDYLPILKQHFIEVEVTTEKQEELEDLSDLLFNFLERFSISRDQSIRKSYLELIADKFKRKKRD